MVRRVWSETEIRDLGVATDLVTAGQILGIGRTKSHELARDNRFPVPVLRIGDRYTVPVAGLLRVLGLSPKPFDANESTHPEDWTFPAKNAFMDTNPPGDYERTET